MIKLINILKELERPKNIYAPGVEPSDLGDEDLVKKGFKLGEPEIDPETGAVSSKVEYLPEFEEIRKYIIKKRKEFQPFKFSSNPDVAKIAKDINTYMTKLSQLIFALDKIIELNKKQ
jgi:hypothetical protein